MFKFIAVCHDRILVHPYVERCQEYARVAVHNLYKKCLPYIARLTENSVLVASLGFCLGVLLTGWFLSIYYHSYYSSIIKTRAMSGVTFDETHCPQGTYLLEAVRSSRIQPVQPFLGRSCQNKLMRSNNFEVNVPVTMCIEVEALAKNYYGCEPILKFSLHGQQA